jgi:hypothetical protein
LNWQTLNELNLAQFAVERSFDARNWNKVGTVTAQNNAQGGSYQLNVAQIDAPFALYRLKLMNKDGSYSYSQQVTLKAKANASVELVGNPVRGTIKVAIHQTQAERYTATLLMVNGTLVRNQVYQHGGGSSVLAMPTEGLAAGSYLLKLTGSTGTSHLLKLVVD